MFPFVNSVSCKKLLIAPAFKKFLKISLLPKILSHKSFSNSLGNSYFQLFAIIFQSHFTSSELVLTCRKGQRYFFYDWLYSKFGDGKGSLSPASVIRILITQFKCHVITFQVVVTTFWSKRHSFMKKLAVILIGNKFNTEL